MGLSSKKLQQFLSCPLCGKQAEKASTIPCGHMFCQRCLEAYLSMMTRPRPDCRGIPPTSIYCPTCFGLTEMTDRGIRGFPESISPNHPAVKMGKNTKVSKDSSQHRVNAICGEDCPKKKQKVVAYCCHCKKGFCALCQGTHAKKNPGHVVITKPRSWQMKCVNHKKVITEFCTTCDVLLCEKCLLTHDDTHTVKKLEERVSQLHTKISQDIDTELPKYMQSKLVLCKQLDKLKALYASKRAGIENDIRREADKHIKKIQDKKNALLSGVQQRYKYLDKAINAHTEYIEYTSRCIDAFRKMTFSMRERGHEPYLLTNYENVRVHSVNINREWKQKCDNMNDIVTCCKFTSSNSMEIGSLEEETVELPQLTERDLLSPQLGWLTQAPQPALPSAQDRAEITLGCGQGEHSVQPQGLVYLPDGHLVVAEYNARRLSILSAEAQENPANNQPIYVQYNDNKFFPRNVVVIDEENNTVAVTDDFEKVVKIFHPRKKPGIVQPKQGNFVSPSGLGFTQEGYFVVSDIGQQNIVVMDQKGHVKARFGNNAESEHSPFKFHGPDFLTIDLQNRILVSDSYNKCIKVFNTSGNFLMQFGQNGSSPLKCPMGICVDKVNHILVADAENHRVCEFDCDGNFVRNVLTEEEHGITWPWGLALSPHGVLSISQRSNDTVKSFQVYNYDMDSDTEPDGLAD